MAFTFELDNKGYLKRRESYNLEYKQNFQLGDSLFKYIKTLVGMANNKGGQIIFGVQNRPHSPVGMSNNRMHDIDPKDIDTRIREHFSPEIKWSIGFQDFCGKSFGMLSVEESPIKPIVCKKTKNDILREGAIYYRYRGETKEIEYSELKNLLEKEKEKERLLWIQHIEKISMAGPQNIHILDKYTGEISYGDKKVLMDESLLDKLAFIREGHFTERDAEGIPTLKLVGTIEGLVDVNNVMIDPNAMYPLTTSQLQEAIQVNTHQIKAIIYSLNLKNKPRHHTEIKQGKKSNPIHKYSTSVVDIIQRLMQQKGRDLFINECTEKYQLYLSKKRQK